MGGEISQPMRKKEFVARVVGRDVEGISFPVVHRGLSESQVKGLLCPDFSLSGRPSSQVGSSLLLGSSQPQTLHSLLLYNISVL